MKSEIHSRLSQRVAKLLQCDLFHPTEKEQKTILRIIRTLSTEENELFYEALVKRKLLFPPYPLKDNIKRRQARESYYIKVISQIINPYLAALPSKAKICDIGCGNGVITVGILKNYIREKRKIYACDLINYLDPNIKRHITFKKKSMEEYLKALPDNYFDGIVDIVTLHHLATKRVYRACLKEIIRVTRVGGLILVVETVHKDWRGLFANAVFDKLLNDRTSQNLRVKNTIPVPLSFLSEEELQFEIEKNRAIVQKRIVMKPDRADPKLHCIYICRKV